MELKDIDFDDDEFKVDAKKPVNETQTTRTMVVPNILPEDDEVYVKKKGPWFTVLMVVLFLITTTLVAIAILYAGKDLFIQKEVEIVEEEVGEPAIYTQTQLDEMVAKAVDEAKEEQIEIGRQEILNEVKKASREDSGIINFIRKINPDDMVFTFGSKFEYFPINRALAPNTINNDNLKVDEETGVITYEVDGVTSSHVCIDVSSFQKDIDWDKVKAAGVEYAIIRCGFRGYGSGKIVEDTFFKSNIEDATSAGIKVGVYFFTQAIDEKEAVEEAEYALKLIEGYDIELPVAIDIEEINDKARTDNLDNDMRSDYCVAFMDRIKEAGYTPMIYTNLKYFIKYLNMDKLEGYEKWFAYYNDNIYFPYEIAIWQYSSTGTIDGIDSSVDLNITFKEY
ncbi:MAG: glycoside hydrolase family 25 protein [Lachnospiraceae bacterium]|nr:glycoside hydrolase family 25 protein [Lachnospiraceae bacterium]